MDQCNLHFNTITILYCMLSMLYWCKESVCWKLDNYNLLYTNQDVLYECPLNSMCRCASFPNDTKLIEINCNEVSLYKFPEFLHNTVKHIEMSRTFIHSIDDETFQGLRLESLKLVDNKILEFSEKSFNFMTHSLITLDFSGNSFQSLPLESIKNIHTLSRLISQRNFIQHLDGNWGNLADSLRSLHVSENEISEITFNHDEKKHNFSTSALSSLPSLIQMHHPLPEPQQQQQIPPIKPQSFKTFAKLRKLVWLDLSSNRISHVGNTLPKSLVTVDLSRNVISQFPTSMVEHLHDLRILNLRDNIITKLADISFQLNKMHLEKIDLSSNIIDELPENLFNRTVHIKAINFDKNFITFVPSNAFFNMNLVHLVLSFNYIDEIYEGAFNGLENSLEYLDLERNFLSKIPSAIYNMNKLRYLYFTSNDISSINPALPSTLKVLSLSSNNFTQIPVEGLINCTDLSYLNMGYNRISGFEQGTFVEWGTQLQTLLLRNNKIARLNYGVFNGLDSIKEISLSFNELFFVHPNVFENISKSLKILELSFSIYSEDYPHEAIAQLTELMWLGLDNNNLKLIPPDSLSTLLELTYINLSFNRLTLIPGNLFLADVHKNLLEIDLSYNSLTTISSNSFASLELLQLINLSSNKIKCLEKSSFYNLPYLTYIDLSYGLLANISESAFEILPNMLSLDIMHNQLYTFSLKVFKHVSNSSTPMRLNISNNVINNFDGELNTYLYIYSLDASNNQLTDTQAFKNIGYSLRVLYLNGNNFSVLNNHAFGDLQLLEILNLADNNITAVRRRSFQGLSNLQELDVSHNKIETLQVEQFSNLKKLRYLKLNHNRIRNLPRDVFLNTRIQLLDLSNNYISVWPVNSFSDIGFTLRSVRLNYNFLEYLDSTMFMNCQYLQELDVSHNQLKVLPDNTFSVLSNLTLLNLSNNPFITTNFKELLLNIPQLRILNLKSTGLFTVPTLYLKYLTDLDLSTNQIQDVDSLMDLQLLRRLNVADNKIFNITFLGRSLPASLRVLDVSRNPIRKIAAHDFTPIRRLEELAIQDIKIINTEAFAKLHSLRTLKISSQANFSEIISKVRALQKLYINFNEHKLDNTFFSRMLSNTKINLIEITGNKLRTVAANAFYGLSRNHNLKLVIKNTVISDLPSGVFYSLKHIPKLSIDLIDNKLSALSPDIFYPNATSWDNIGTRIITGGLDISGNPLQCDCGHVWLGHWLRRWLRETAQINIINKEEAKRMLMRARESLCYDPTSGKWLTFLEIFPEDLLCHASALSSLALTLKFKYLILHLATITIFVYRTFFVL